MSAPAPERVPPEARDRTLRIVFMGTPDFAAVSLQRLLDAGHQIACVYTQPPRAAGRGQKPRPSPVQRVAESAGLTVRTPTSLKGEEERAALAAFEADLAVVAAYGLLLPQSILDVPALGCVNVHASLLPRWRGAAPIQRAIEAGDSKTGVTIMQMDAGLDTGPMLLAVEMPMPERVTGGELHDLLADIGAEALLAAIDDLAAGTATPVPQPAEGATYAAKLDKAEAAIDWQRPAAELDRRIRAFTPWPGAHCTLDGVRLKVLAASPAADTAAAESAAPGTVVAVPCVVATGAGALALERVQAAGKAALAIEDFVRGRPIPIGTCLK